MNDPELISITVLRNHYGVHSLEYRSIQLDLIVLRNILRYRIQCPELLRLINLHTPTRFIRNPHAFHVTPAKIYFDYNLPIYRLHRLGNYYADMIDVFDCSKGEIID